MLLNFQIYKGQGSSQYPFITSGLAPGRVATLAAFAVARAAAAEAAAGPAADAASMIFIGAGDDDARTDVAGMFVVVFTAVPDACAAASTAGSDGVIATGFASRVAGAS